MWNLFDWFFGRGIHAVTVPSMDGALRPNAELDTATVLASAESADNAVARGDILYFTSGNNLYRMKPGGPAAALEESFSSPVTALACGPSGELAIALEEGSIVVTSGGTKTVLHGLASMKGGVTALAFKSSGSLVVAVGSSVHPSERWQADLLERNARGSAWILDVSTDKPLQLAGNLAYPSGALVRGNDAIVSEAWKHRLLRIPLSGGAATQVLGDLPAYPGRLADDGAGGVWLCCFAPRSQLIELVLRESRYRKRMLKEVPMRYWIAPALSSGHSFQEPLQGGAVKQMGILKPWAPTRSYGLVVRLGYDFQPVGSYHSRSDGHRHGVTSAAPFGNGLVVTSRGGNLVLQVG